jgi:hypothetical protein
MMPDVAVTEFAQALVQWVRDPAIRSCDRYLGPAERLPIGARWAETIAAASAAEAVGNAIPDCVDETIFYLLRAIDQGVLRISYTNEAGESVDLTEVGMGEMSGWYMGSGGWRSQYSEQRYVDDFADIAGSDPS